MWKTVSGTILFLIGGWMLFPEPYGFGMWESFWELLQILMQRLGPTVLVIAGLVMIWIESEEKKLKNIKKKK